MTVVLLLKMKCHLDLPLLSKKVTAKEAETGRKGNRMIRLKEKTNETNRQSETENLRGRDRERIGERRVIAGKGAH